MQLNLAVGFNSLILFGKSSCLADWLCSTQGGQIFLYLSLYTSISVSVCLSLSHCLSILLPPLTFTPCFCRPFGPPIVIHAVCRLPRCPHLWGLEIGLRVTPRRPTYATAHLHLQCRLTIRQRLSWAAAATSEWQGERVASTGLGEAQANLPSVRLSCCRPEGRQQTERKTDRQITRARQRTVRLTGLGGRSILSVSQSVGRLQLIAFSRLHRVELHLHMDLCSHSRRCCCCCLFGFLFWSVFGISSWFFRRRRAGCGYQKPIDVGPRRAAGSGH